MVLHAALGSSIRFRCPAARFMLPTPQRKGGRVWLVYCVCYCPSQARACFVWEFVYGRSAAPNRGYWHLCRAVGGGARGPACRAPGSIGGVFALSPSFLIPGKAAFCSLCCQIYPRRSGFCLHLAPSCWYLSQPTLLPLVHPRNDSACSCSVRLIDSYRSFGLHSVLSALLQTPLVWQTWLLKRSPPSQLPDPAVRHSAALAVPTPAPSTSIAQPAHTPSPRLPVRPH